MVEDWKNPALTYRALFQGRIEAGGLSIPVLGVAAQGEFAGLDQANIGPLDRRLAGRGAVGIVLSIGAGRGADEPSRSAGSLSLECEDVPGIFI